MDLINDLLIVLLLIPVIAVHEFAHAFAADRLGDPTPRLSGRLTLNPLAHLDPIGTLALLFFKIGWGKPVMFNPYNLKNPKRDQAIIAFAGPLSNILLAVILALLYRVIGPINLVDNVFQALIGLNLVLAFFNLLPIGPLDGFKVVLGILPHSLASDWLELERYGIFILIFILISGLAGKIIFIPANFFLELLI